MGEFVKVDPITRIEGHMGIEVEIEGGKVKDAWTSGTLFRGFEIFLKGRDPRDAWHITQRICGVCPTSHGHTSAMSIDNAVGVKLPENGRLIRNIIEGCQFVHSHILWFYHLNALDYVDVVSALSAKPADNEEKGVQAKLKGLVDSGQLGPFSNGYWGHPGYALSPELNLHAVVSYLQALNMQAKASHMSAIFGGRMPMTMTSPPGGSSARPDMDQVTNFLFRLDEVKSWVMNRMLPDTMAIAPPYLGAAGIGKGPGNFLAWGVFEDASFDPKKRLLPRGAIVDGKLAVVDAKPESVTESVKHGWYKDGAALNPANGVTEPNFTEYDRAAKYSWAKAPRLDNKPMEVGALSRVLVAYLSGQPDVKKYVDTVTKALNIKVTDLFGLIGRIAARTIETIIICEQMEKWAHELAANIQAGKTETFASYEMPDSAQGIGLWEAPRGALGHWIDIKGKVINNYQCVVPTTWNVAPRDDKGVRGPIEEALVGTAVADPKKPLELLRVVHSFDPCIACTVHVIEPESNQILKFEA